MPLSKTMIRDQAIQWLIRRHSGDCTEAERQEFKQWLAQSDIHRIEYDKARQFWAGMKGLGSARFPEIDAARRYDPFRWYRRSAAVAAMVLITTALGLLLFNSGKSEHLYKTVKGEQKQVILADGTEIDLNTDTELIVMFSKDSRVIHLKRGEALFNVVHDETKPFDVVAGKGHIRDLGTRFTVHRRVERQSVSVIVVEGKVSVTTDPDAEPRSLSAGEHLEYDASGALTPVDRVDTETATAWHKGRLVFKNVPLNEMIKQIERYHPLVVLINDPDLGRLEVSGTFKIDDLDHLLWVIEATLPVKANKLNNGTVRLDRISHAAGS